MESANFNPAHKAMVQSDVQSEMINQEKTSTVHSGFVYKVIEKVGLAYKIFTEIFSGSEEKEDYLKFLEQDAQRRKEALGNATIGELFGMYFTEPKVETTEGEATSQNQSNELPQDGQTTYPYTVTVSKKGQMTSYLFSPAPKDNVS